MHAVGCGLSTPTLSALWNNADAPCSALMAALLQVGCSVCLPAGIGIVPITQPWPSQFSDVARFTVCTLMQVHGVYYRVQCGMMSTLSCNAGTCINTAASSQHCSASMTPVDVSAELAPND
jgi:hypothetical protein